MRSINQYRKSLLHTTRDFWNNNPWVKLKREHQQFYETVLLREAELTKYPPQILQGMWQAYGQMRAARTLAGGAIVTTGILGIGLWVFQQSLSRQKSLLDQSQIKLHEKEQALIVAEEKLQTKESVLHNKEAKIAAFDFTSWATESELKVADDEIAKVYGGRNDMRYEQYLFARNKAKEEAFKNTQKEFGIAQEMISDSPNSYSDNPNKPTR